MPLLPPSPAFSKSVRDSSHAFFFSFFFSEQQILTNTTPKTRVPTPAICVNTKVRAKEKAPLRKKEAPAAGCETERPKRSVGHKPQGFSQRQKVRDQPQLISWTPKPGRHRLLPRISQLEPNSPSHRPRAGWEKGGRKMSSLGEFQPSISEEPLQPSRMARRASWKEDRSPHSPLPPANCSKG